MLKIGHLYEKKRLVKIPSYSYSFLRFEHGTCANLLFFVAVFGCYCSWGSLSVWFGV
jgi:hypothetical protein